MQCDYCDSKATVFFTQIVDGQTTKSSLCEKCATEHGVTDPEGFLIGHIQAIPQQASEKMSQKQQPTEEVVKETASHLVCPGCGFAFEDLKKTGRLGCSQCYQYFRDDIKHNLTGMHKGVCHHGRVPEGMLEAFEKRQQLEKLQLAMNEAIDTEDYEKAAAIRDEITQLQKKNQSAESVEPISAP